jgi:hypothetical protein
MNIEITPSLINSTGLTLDIIGVWLVAIEIVFQFKGQTLKDPTIYCDGSMTKPEDTEKYSRDKQIKHKAMWFGLILLTVGFALQITSNHLPAAPNISSMQTETGLPNQNTQKQSLGKNQSHQQKSQLKETQLSQIKE